VISVAVGAFENDDVGAIRCAWRWQQGRVGGAEVAGEDDALLVLALGDCEFEVG